MPRFNVGDRVVNNLHNIPPHARDAYQRTFPNGCTVTNLLDGGRVEIQPIGRTGLYSTYNIQEQYFTLDGPPETVRDMSYKVMREAGYA